MCLTLCPHRRQHTRLPCPWDSPGKNTGVGCHFLFQCMKVKSESEVAQLCQILHDPMDCSPPGSSVHGIFQASKWTGSPLPSPKLILDEKKHSNWTISKKKVLEHYLYLTKAEYRESVNRDILPTFKEQIPPIILKLFFSFKKEGKFLILLCEGKMKAKHDVFTKIRTIFYLWLLKWRC